MKNICFILLWGISGMFPDKIFSQTNEIKKESKMDTNQIAKKSQASERIFIDRFTVPKQSSQEFLERMNISRSFIKSLPGFIEDDVYERRDEQGNLVYVTVAVWASEDDIKKAREAVQAEYKKEGFNLQAMIERLNITMMERGIYTRH